MGLIIDDCHKLHGYPDDFEFTKNKTSVSSVKGNVAFSNQDGQEQFISHVNEGVNTCSHASREANSTQYQPFTARQKAKIARMFREL